MTVSEPEPKRAWVVNTGPLIFLSKLGRLDLLKSTSETLYVAQAVVGEILAKPDEAARNR